MSQLLFDVIKKNIKSKEINETTDKSPCCITDSAIHALDGDSALAAARLEHDLERHPELRVEVGVEEWVYCGVEVSKPLRKGEVGK